MSGFYEFHIFPGGRKERVYVHLQDRPMFCVAGVWERKRGEDLVLRPSAEGDGHTRARESRCGRCGRWARQLDAIQASNEEGLIERTG